MVAVAVAVARKLAIIMHRMWVDFQHGSPANTAARQSVTREGPHRPFDLRYIGYRVANK